MATFRQLTLTALFMVLLLTQMPVFAVDYYQQQLQNEQMLKRQLELQKKMENDRYIRQVGDKALNGFTNIVTAPLEMPKSMINYTNHASNNYGNNNVSNSNYTNNDPDDNIFYGLVGGVISGTLNTTGRIVTGVTDLVTAPLPTKPIVQPRYVWDDFDKTNSYGPVFRLVDNPPIEPYVAPPPRPVAVVQPVDDQAEQYSQQTNRNLDAMFEHEMQK
jgi:putative exosortase-associated protein (TIGR04073 family)